VRPHGSINIRVPVHPCERIGTGIVWRFIRNDLADHADAISEAGQLGMDWCDCSEDKGDTGEKIHSRLR
jgi:hypothetical protein